SEQLSPANTAAALRRIFLRLKTLAAGPRLQQRAIHREVLVVQQSCALGLRPYPLEELLRYLAAQQPIPILREYRHVPHRTVDLQPHEPAIPPVAVDLIHELTFAADRV